MRRAVRRLGRSQPFPSGNGCAPSTYYLKGATMKIRKVLFISLIILLTLTLTSCRVNWFDTHYDVPWYVIAIPTAIFAAVIFLIAGKTISNKCFVCPKCGERFHPDFFVSMFSMHIGSDRYFKCPKCGRKGFCPVARDQEE